MSVNCRADLSARATTARRAAYSLAAGAAAGLVQQADAGVVYSGIENFNIDQRNYLPLGLDGNNLSDIYLKNYINPYVGTQGNFQGAFVRFAPGRLVAKKVGNLAYVKALGAGFLVDNTSVHADVFTASMAFGANHPNAEFNNIQNAYIGFSFAYFPSSPPPPPEEREMHYGWIRVSINNAAGTFVAHDWAYESQANLGIRTGDMGDAGDFNDDGVVDAADYTVWRDLSGQSGNLAADANEDDMVDAEDYALSKANFRRTELVGGGALASVPEPSSFVIALLAACGLAYRRGRFAE